VCLHLRCRRRTVTAVTFIITTVRIKNITSNSKMEAMITGRTNAEHAHDLDIDSGYMY
jgi:hypothetical protein